ncbi:uncharacterized protein [Glycine max]|uniref:uncharacterized protein n=1 Tax=Glycine max TaxID=3847 RepID=UPI001B357263|nr:uncharacterized protein LOC121172843 [Glycine max]
MSLMIIKRGIPEVFRGIVSDDITSAKDFLAEIEKLFAKSDKAETSTLLQNLIYMRYQVSYGEPFNTKLRGTKRRIDNTNSRALWYKRLGHISKNKIERLVSNRILDSIDFISFDVCVECIKDMTVQVNNVRGLLPGEYFVGRDLDKK